MMIWIAADKVYPGVMFTKYAVLGDAVVIADQRVAEQYLDTLEWYGIPISKSKSGCARARAFYMICNFLSSQHLR